MRRRLDVAAVAGVIALVWLVVVRDLLAPYVVFGHSAYVDLVRQVAVDHALSARGAFPWWVPEFYFGCGSPIFFYYAPLPYMIAAAFSAVGFGTVYGLKLVYVLGVLAAGITMYRLGRTLFGRWAGLSASVLYMAAPYMLLDLFVRASIGEVVAMAIAPEVFGQLARLERTGRVRHLAGCAVAMALLVIAHNISAMVLAPFVCAYAGLVWLRTGGSRLALLAPTAVALGLALSAWFWLPALAGKDLVHAEQGLTTGHFHYGENFIAPRTLVAGPWAEGAGEGGLDATLPTQLGWPQLALAIAGLLLAFRRPKPEIADVAFFGALAAIAVFLTLAASRFAWESLPLIRFVQFPWRFLLPASFGLALVGGSVAGAPDEGARGAVGWVALGTAVIVLAYSGPLASAKYLLHDRARHKPVPVDRALAEDPGRWPASYARPEEVLTIDTLLALGVTSTAQNDYLPIGVDRPPVRRPGAPFEVLDGDLVVERTENRGDRFAFAVSSDEGGTLRVPVFYFPGWEAAMGGEPVAVRAQKRTGLLLVDVPPGDDELSVRFTTRAFRGGTTWFSLAALAVLAILVAAVYVTDRRAGIATRGRR